MLAVEISYGAAILILGLYAGITDIKEGRVYNKALLVFASISVILGAIYYGYFARDLIVLFLVNLGLLAITSLILFYTHSFAGGDCKLTIVMGMLYPANYYLVYGKNNSTLFFALGFAIFYGYVYLLISSFRGLINGKNKLSKDYIKRYLSSFVKSFISATTYISFVNLALIFLYTKGFNIRIWIIRLICIAVAWTVGKYSFLKKWYIVAGVFLLDIIMGLALRTMPFSINPENYIMVVVLLLCQMTIRTNIYEEVLIEDLKEGMILSSFSSMLMQNSRVRGLPGISAEDLRSRLSAEEIASIKRWKSGRDIQTLSVVRKMPFAVFIFLGFVSYFIFGSAEKWYFG